MSEGNRPVNVSLEIMLIKMNIWDSRVGWPEPSIFLACLNRMEVEMESRIPTEAASNKSDSKAPRA